MARIPLTEYAAKQLILGDVFTGISVTPTTHTQSDDLSGAHTYVVKVDQGVKKRGKQGLIKVGVQKNEIVSAVEELCARGFDRCLVEPLIPHNESDERYLSIELTREGARIITSDQGGVAIEEHTSTLKTYLVPLKDTLAGKLAHSPIPDVPIPFLIDIMARYHLSFLEVNPYVIQNNQWIPLDLAVLIDSTKTQTLPSSLKEHVVTPRAATPEEDAVRIQDAGSQASLNLHILNPHGSILTLLSGGGASLVALDALVAAGLGDSIINYSEYSGAPTRDETRAYADTLLKVLAQSDAPQKTILIAGGVANFTDIRDTFRGLVDAFTDNLALLKKEQVRVCIRRGGPHQEEGLAHMRTFLEREKIPSSVHGPEQSLATIGSQILHLS